MPIDLAPPAWWQWALLAPSLALLAWVIARGLKAEAAEPPPGRWSLADLAAVALVFAGVSALLALAGEVPFVPEGLRIGALVLLVDGATSAAILGVFWMSGQPAEALGLRPPRRPANSAAVVLAVAAFLIPCWLFNAGWLHLLHALGYEPRAQPALEVYLSSAARGEWTAVALLSAGAVVAAPLFEELLFRGLLYGALLRRMGPRTAAVLTSAAFALFHQRLELLAPILVVGLALNWVYVRTGSLFYPVLFHALFNGSALAGVWLE